MNVLQLRQPPKPPGTPEQRLFDAAPYLVPENLLLLAELAERLLVAQREGLPPPWSI